MVSRRRFLALGPVLAATAASGPSSLMKDVFPARVASAAPGELVRSTFVPHVNGTFTVHVGPLQRIATRLVAIEDLPGAAHAAADREGRFALFFDGPGAEALAQGTYSLEHPALGTFPLFLVPVGGRDDVRHYQAVFNRIGAAPAREA